VQPVTLPTEIDKFSNWPIHRAETCLIAGPCSVESEEQILGTAVELAKCNVTLLRGGIWKPRTRPGSFEGIGEKGLSWLKAAGRATGLPVATEIATPAHVEQCLKANIDVLWIGARTTTSPIAVQALADSLAGVDVPVMIKNPMNPELGLWTGAIERVRGAGIKRVVAVHRGFSTHIRHKYRNRPLWGIPLELRRRMPEIPIVCDPSHICGAQQYIASVAQYALEIGLDGLMIESHWRPESALSDPGQQLSPAQFAELVRQMACNANPCTAVRNRDVTNLWRQIAEVDQDLSALLSKRGSILRQIEARGTKENRISSKAWANICATRLMTAVVKQLPGNAKSKRGAGTGGGPQTETRSSDTRNSQFQSEAGPCSDSVMIEGPA
jgi:chorismate mutase